MQIFFLRATGRCAFFKLRYYRLRQYWIFHKILRKLRGIYRKRLPCLLPLNSNATKSQHELIQKSKQQNNPQVTLWRSQSIPTDWTRRIIVPNTGVQSRPTPNHQVHSLLACLDPRTSAEAQPMLGWNPSLLSLDSEHVAPAFLLKRASSCFYRHSTTNTLVITSGPSHLEDCDHVLLDEPLIVFIDK